MTPSPIRLAEVDASTEREYMAGYLFPCGYLSMLYADGGNGKSVLATAAALNIAAGIPFLGNSVTTSSTLYIDFELTPKDSKIIAERIAYGVGLDNIPSDLWYLPARENGDSLSEVLAWLPQWVVPNGIRFIVLDSLSIALEVEPREFSPVIRALRTTNWLSEANAAMLILDHQAKQQAGESYSSKTPLGAIVKRNLCRSVWQIQHKGGSSFVLRHEKDNFIHLREPLNFEIEFGENDDGPIVFAVKEKQDSISKDQGKILELLISHPGGMSVADIAKALGKPATSVAVQVNRLHKKSLVCSENRGIWRPKTS